LKEEHMLCVAESSVLKEEHVLCVAESSVLKEEHMLCVAESRVLKEEHVLCVAESRVLKKIFGRQREEVTGNKEFSVFSHNTTLLFDKSPTCFGYCFVALIRPIPRYDFSVNNTKGKIHPRTGHYSPEGK
jgi:hypothetical protein